MEGQLRIIRSARATLAGALIALSPALPALSPPPPQPDDELLPLLYETLGGDQWHNNDGWLDPEVHWCDWYGVECGEEFMGYYAFEGLELPDNNLNGELTEELAKLLFANSPPTGRLDLSGNSITGPLHFYPRLTDFVDVSGNSLSGELPLLKWPSSMRPNGIGDEALVAEQRLFLARNAFSGSIPSDWSEAMLEFLDLSDNQLTAGHQTAIDAIKSGGGNGYVYLTGNPLEGELTDAVLSAPLSERDELGAYGGIGICFTKLTVDDPVVRDWLAEHHAASSDFEQCLDRERTEIDATLSGSWYNPGRSGEGVSLMMLDNGAPLLYSFSFDTQGYQQWLFEVGDRGVYSLEWDRLLETRGTFAEGIDLYQDQYAMIRGVADFRFDRVGIDSLQVQRNYYDWSGCGEFKPQHPDVPLGPGLCVTPLHSDRMDYQRLSELAGTTCDNQSDFQQYSGAWYNPERAGEGLIVEILPGEGAVVYWFTYLPENRTPERPGDQAWFIANSEIEPLFTGVPPPGPYGVAMIEAETVLQPTGGTWGEAFDPAAVESLDVLDLTLTFNNDGSAHLAWSDDGASGFGSGDYPLERLARPMLAECGQGENQ